MIITKKISIILNPSNMHLLSKHGIFGKKGEFVEIDISLLPMGSKYKITAICSVCGEFSEVMYLNYNKQTKNNTKDYYCKKCKTIKSKKTNLEKYGFDNPTKSQEIKDKIKKTNLEKYGTENVFQSQEIKDKIKKTNLEKYGKESYTQTEEYLQKSRLTKTERYNNPNYTNFEKSKETNLKKYGVETILPLKHVRDSLNLFRENNLDKILEKTKKTNLEKYGVEFVFESDLIKDKIKKTNLERYGVDQILKSDFVKSKIKKTNLERWGVDNPSKSKEIQEKKLIKSDHKFKSKYGLVEVCGKYIKSYCKICKNTFEIEKSLFFNRKRYKMNDCTICLPINSYSKSGKENEIFNFIKEFENSAFQSARSLIKGGELDIFVPERNLAFEFNGTYWHSELHKDRMYHYHKTSQCKKIGIDLFHIWEDDWNIKSDIIKSMILNKIGKTPNKIHARKCKLEEINDNKLVRDFLDENHLQGFIGSSIKIGLFYNGDLVSLMTFGSLRKSLGQISQHGKYEMIRFCNKKMTNVVGGASKIIKYFIKKYNPIEIISYSDSSRSNGNLYEKLGFEFEKETSPNYYWVVDNVRKHRFNFRKDKLVRQGFDPDKTEIEIMRDQGYYRIWDCGSKKWKMSFHQ